MQQVALAAPTRPFNLHIHRRYASTIGTSGSTGRAKNPAGSVDPSAIPEDKGSVPDEFIVDEEAILSSQRKALADAERARQRQRAEIFTRWRGKYLLAKLLLVFGLSIPIYLVMSNLDKLGQHFRYLHLLFRSPFLQSGYLAFDEILDRTVPRERRLPPLPVEVSLAVFEAMQKEFRLHIESEADAKLATQSLTTVFSPEKTAGSNPSSVSASSSVWSWLWPFSGGSNAPKNNTQSASTSQEPSSTTTDDSAFSGPQKLLERRNQILKEFGAVAASASQAAAAAQRIRTLRDNPAQYEVVASQVAAVSGDDPSQQQGLDYEARIKREFDALTQLQQQAAEADADRPLTETEIHAKLPLPALASLPTSAVGAEFVSPRALQLSWLDTRIKRDDCAQVVRAYIAMMQDQLRIEAQKSLPEIRELQPDFQNVPDEAIVKGLVTPLNKALNRISDFAGPLVHGLISQRSAAVQRVLLGALPAGENVNGFATQGELRLLITKVHMLALQSLKQAHEQTQSRYGLKDQVDEGAKNAPVTGLIADQKVTMLPYSDRLENELAVSSALKELQALQVESAKSIKKS